MKLGCRRGTRWLAVTLLMTIAVGCGSDPSVSFSSVNNNPGTFDTDFTGEGGSVIETFPWMNTATRAEYSMDITATSAARVGVVVHDADGVQVASFGLSTSSPDDTLDCVSRAGKPGNWTIEVSLQDFVGDGSLNLNSGE